MASLDPAALALDDSAIVRLAVNEAPGVQQAQALVTAASASVRAAKSQYAPTIQAGGGYNWANDGQVTGALRQGWVVQVGTSFPLFNGFVREDAVTRANVTAEVASSSSADVRRLSRAEALRLLGSLHVSEQDVALAAEAVRLAMEDLRVISVRYRAGIATHSRSAHLATEPGPGRTGPGQRAIHLSGDPCQPRSPAGAGAIGQPMMWLVRIALRRPYTFVCGALLVLIGGLVSISRMAVDIFPAIPIPVVTVIWTYQGMAPEEMEQRIVTIMERSYSTTVNDIEHIESQSLAGSRGDQDLLPARRRRPHRRGADHRHRRRPTPGICRRVSIPPIILRFNATDVPVLQIGIGSDSMSSAELNDYVSNFVRTPLTTAQGAAIPFPFGGVPRLINVDLDLARLYAKGLSPADVSTAINAQNVILPAGTAKLGTREYNVRLNSSPDVVSQLNDMPITEVNGAMVYVRDVAQVRDGAGRADQHRAAERSARYLPLRAPERQRVQPRRGEPGEGDARLDQTLAAFDRSTCSSWRISRSSCAARSRGCSTRLSSPPVSRRS